MQGGRGFARLHSMRLGKAAELVETAGRALLEQLELQPFELAA